MWQELTSQKDIDDFMKEVTDFHDSCLKEIKYKSGAYTDGKWMHVINDLRVVNVIFQGFFGIHSAIELEFSKLHHLILYPIHESHTCEIFDAKMFLIDGLIYWCDNGDIKEEDLEDYEGTIICAERIRWRRVDEFLGEDDIFVYGKDPEETP